MNEADNGSKRKEVHESEGSWLRDGEQMNHESIMAPSPPWEDKEQTMTSTEKQ